MASLRSFRAWTIVIAGAFAAAAVIPLVAQEVKDKKEKQADPKAAAQKDSEGDKADDERYVVPATDSKARLAFITKLRQFQPKTRAEAVEHFKKMKEAAEKLIALEKDAASLATLKAKAFLLEMDLGNTFRRGPEAHAKFYGEVKDILLGLGDNLSPAEAGLAVNTVRMLEMGQSDKVLEANETFAKLYSKSKDDNMAQIAGMFEGTVRRLKLPGNEMKITGTTVEGKEFDWASYRGKVVLVDFWATWCGPCLAELPNVKQAFERYHDKGFEVIGISLDQDREALDNFLKEEKLPWVTLHQKGGRHPAAEYYAISSIPTVILVGKDGKVVSLNARGEALGEHLEKLLGPTEQATKKTDKE
jgi:thiol-disulfide isomerase/thioredoxin